MLDVVAVYPQKQHVPRKMQEPAVEKHAEEEVAQLRGPGLVSVDKGEQIIGTDLIENLPERNPGWKMGHYGSEIFLQRGSALSMPWKDSGTVIRI